MKQVTTLVALLMFSAMASAQVLPPSPLVLDKISFQTSAKQWVNTQTALLSVGINITINNSDMVKARTEIMSSLNKISPAEWHLLEFDRSQDSSGLEKLSVQAQARVNQGLLNNIYQSAKTVSKAGAQYTINGVEFKPSLEEIQNVHAGVRKQLYKQISDELDRINKAYPSQNYSLSNLVIYDGESPQPPVAYQAKTMNAMAVTNAAPAPLSVSNELLLTAFVEVASNRKPGN